MKRKCVEFFVAVCITCVLVCLSLSISTTNMQNTVKKRILLHQYGFPQSVSELMILYPKKLREMFGELTSGLPHPVQEMYILTTYTCSKKEVSIRHIFMCQFSCLWVNYKGIIIPGGEKRWLLN